MSYPDYVETVTAPLARRLIDLIGTRLAIPIAPIAGEGLADLVFRAAHVNCLPNLGGRWAKPALRDLSHLGVTLGSPDLKDLGDLLGTPDRELNLLPIVFHKFRPDKPNGQRGRLPFARFCSFFGARMPTVQLLRDRRVSPRSLRGAEVSKAMWHLSALTFEPDTLEVLLQACPTCGKRLDFKNARAFCKCDACQTDFREVEQPIVQVEDRQALRFVTDLIDPLRHHQCDALQVPPALAKLDRGSLFMLCVFIAKILDKNFDRGDGGKLISLSGACVSPSNLSLAGRAILEWPFGIDKLNRVLGQILSDNAINAEMRDPFRKFIKKNESFDKAMVAAFDAAVVPTIKISLAATGKAEKACRSPLVPAPPIHGADKSSLPSEVKDLHWSRSFVSARDDTGLPRGVLSDFVFAAEKQSANARDRADFLRGLKQELFLRSSALPQAQQDALPLKSVIAALYLERGNPWPDIIRAVLHRELPLSVDISKPTWIESLRVSEFDVWSEYCRCLQPFTDTLDLPIGWRDVCFHLGVSLCSFNKRFVQHFGSKNLFTLRYLHKFRLQYISVGELHNSAYIGGTPRSSKLIARELKRLGILSVPGLAGFYPREIIRDLYFKTA